ncbi:MAG: protein BatD [Bacteroidales bacterium]|nr:protein BatD [Bacteroidales bacterium]
MRTKKLYILILFAAISGAAIAQDIEFKATANPRVLRIGEQLRLEYSLNEDVSELEIPEFNGFQLLGGPMTGSSTSIQIINGKTTRSSQYTYTYYLRAAKEGTFTIPPAKAQLKGKTYESNALTIEVVGSGATQQQSAQPQGQTQPQTGTPPAASKGEDVFVRLHVDKHSAYLGEQIVAWVKVYTKLQLSGLGQGYKGPEFTGFYKQPVEIPQLTSLEPENVNGDIYYTGIIQKVVLYPQKTGELSIEPFDLVVTTRQQVRSRSRSLFDEFFGPAVQDVPRTLRSNLMKIKVKPLPGKPQSFTGAVGNFSLKSSVDKTELKTNEAITYKITISGKGNIKLVDEPNISFPLNIEQFDPKTTINQANELSGSKTFEYVLIPRYAGEYNIPAFDFTFFDPANGRFTTLSTTPYTINVAKGDEDTTAVVVSGLSKEDFRLLGKDILFIKNKPLKLKKQDDLVFGSTVFYLAYIMSLVLFGLIIILRRETIKRNANLVMVKNRKANKQARKRLKKAKDYLAQQKQDLFYEEVMKALWGYLGDKLIIPVADLSRDKSRELLQQRNADEKLISDFYTLLDSCEYARFAPDKGTADMQKLYTDAVLLISKLEQSLKN